MPRPRECAMRQSGAGRRPVTGVPAAGVVSMSVVLLATAAARSGVVDANGTTVSPILGPVLDGNGFAAIPDTDGGRLDGNQVWDRAVGPMQFLPSTWTTWSADGNGDHRADPNNVFDASLAAA